MKRKHICIIFSICMILVGCAKTVDEKDRISEPSTADIQIQEQIDSNIRIDINKSFSVESLKKYWIKSSLYPVSRQWTEALIETYYKSDSEAKILETVENTFEVSEENHYLSVQPTHVFLYTNKEFYENAYPYYQSKGFGKFFHDEMDDYYSQNDLDFMTYHEAKNLAVSLLSYLEYNYEEEEMMGYSLAESALTSYQTNHQDYFETFKINAERLDIKYTESWLGTGGFYIFYFPPKLENIQLDMEKMNTIMYSYIAVTKDGIAFAYIPSSYYIEKSEEISIVNPEVIVDNVIHMYKNTISTSDVTINDMNFVFSQTGTEVPDDSTVLEDTAYIVSPLWKFNVQLKENGSVTSNSIYYDASTGEISGN